MLNNKLSSESVKKIGWSFLILGFLSVVFSFLNVLQEWINEAYLLGLGFIFILFGSTLLFGRAIPLKVGISGFLLTYISAALCLYIGFKTELTEFILWFSSLSVIVGLFFLMSILTKPMPPITKKMKERKSELN